MDRDLESYLRKSFQKFEERKNEPPRKGTFDPGSKEDTGLNGDNHATGIKGGHNFGYSKDTGSYASGGKYTGTYTDQSKMESTSQPASASSPNEKDNSGSR